MLNYISMEAIKRLCGSWRWSLEAPWLDVLQLWDEPAQGPLEAWVLAGWGVEVWGGVIFPFFPPPPPPPFIFFFLSCGSVWFSWFKSDLPCSFCLYPGCSIPLRICFLAALCSYLQEFFSSKRGSSHFSGRMLLLQQQRAVGPHQQCQPFAMRHWVCICSASDVSYHGLGKRFWQETAL